MLLVTTGKYFLKRLCRLSLRPAGAFKVDETVIWVRLYQAHAYLLANNKPPFSS